MMLISLWKLYLKHEGKKQFVKFKFDGLYIIQEKLEKIIYIH